MRCVACVFALTLVLVDAGCGNGSDSGGELDAKSEYSVLQNFEFDYRATKQERSFFVIRNALSSGYDVIGLPRANSERGYVWVIANPSSMPAVKQIPSEAGFSIDLKTLVAIEKLVRLNPTVRSYLVVHIETNNGVH